MAEPVCKNTPPQRTFTILAWNTNGLLARKQEFTYFLYSFKIDIALISETHLTKRSYVEIQFYDLYTGNHPNHPSGSRHGGAAIYVWKDLAHHEILPYSTLSMQAAGISAKLQCGTWVNIVAVYSSPHHKIKCVDYDHFFQHFGSKWIIGGDFNAKHEHWGSRLCTSKGRELYHSVTQIDATCISAGKLTYWPSDPQKHPDFVVRGISFSTLIWITPVISPQITRLAAPPNIKLWYHPQTIFSKAHH